MKLEGQLKGKLRCFLKDTKRVFKLYILPSQGNRRKLLDEIEHLSPEVFACFIANAQSSFSDIEYGYSYSSVVRKTFFKNEYYTKIIVLPVQLIRVVAHPHTMLSKEFIFEEVYPELRGVDCFVMDVYSSYKFYDVYTDKVDKKLINFNSRFDDLIKRLIDVRLNNLYLNYYRYPLKSAMDSVIHKLEKNQLQR